MSQDTEWVHETLRLQREKAREAGRDALLGQRRRFEDEDDDKGSSSSRRVRKRGLASLLRDLKSRQFRDASLLADLKQSLASGGEEGDGDSSCPDDLFAVEGALSGLVGVLTDPQADLQLLAAQCLANLSPLGERNGIQLARSAGPYLVTLLSSGSARLQEASCVALGNLALSGARVVRVLVNQEAVTSLVSALRQSAFENVQASVYYALYHILHTSSSSSVSSSSLSSSLSGGGSDAEASDLLRSLVEQCRAHMSVKCPPELHWVLFVLSCNPDLHSLLHASSFVARALDICTYEIFQKSDSRPLVRIVTPIVRTLANLCAGPEAAEQTCLAVLRYPDLQAILMALLGTNYSHICKETLWLFSNVVNCESVVVQEELVEMDFMDKMEFHTVQAIQRLDPYGTHNM